MRNNSGAPFSGTNKVQRMLHHSYHSTGKSMPLVNQCWNREKKSLSANDNLYYFQGIVTLKQTQTGNVKGVAFRITNTSYFQPTKSAQSAHKQFASVWCSLFRKTQNAKRKPIPVSEIFITSLSSLPAKLLIFLPKYVKIYINKQLCIFSYVIRFLRLTKGKAGPSQVFEILITFIFSLPAKLLIFSRRGI